MIEFQHTLKQAVSLEGTGLHTGQHVTVQFCPAPPNHGFKFKRIDLPDQPVIAADADLVTETERGTTLTYNNAKVSTIEHVLAALSGMGIDNALIEIDGQEMPIMDGSAMPFVEKIEAVGIEAQNAVRDYFILTENIHFRDAKKDCEFVAIPSNDYQIQVMIDYNSPVLGKQHAILQHLNHFKDDIAPARTFCFLHELELLLQYNLIKGGDLNNAIVVVDKPVEQAELDRLAVLFGKPSVQVRREGYLNNLELRHANEPARHKLLDVLGDLALIGKPIKTRIIATKPGHASNVAFAQHIKAYIRKNKHLANIPRYNPELPPVYDIRRITDSLPHRFPFLLIDKIIELSDKHVVGVKNVTFNENFFQGHFPGHPIMPGVLIIEAMAQTGGILTLSTVPDPANYLTYFLRIEHAKFRHPVVPGDTLLFKLDLLSPIRRGICEMQATAFVGSKIVAEAVLTAQMLKR